MSYTKRVWENTGEEVTYEDFNRIEQGIESNDLEISKQKDATKEGSLAKQIADIKDETQEGSLAQKIADAEEQINDCLKRENRISEGDIKDLLIANAIKLDTVYLVSNAVTNMPTLSYYELHVYGADYNSIILVAYDQWSNNQYWTRFNTTVMTNIVWNKVSSDEMIDLSTITFLNGFSRYVDTSFGCISRSGKIVHVNMLLATNGAGNNVIFKLPFIPARNQIHICYGLEFRTNIDGSLLLNGVLPNTNNYMAVEFDYTCI